MYIIVTGAAGFIGSNIVRALGERGEYNVLAVDDLQQGDKFANLVDCDVADYMDKDEFLEDLNSGSLDGEIALISTPCRSSRGCSGSCSAAAAA